VSKLNSRTTKAQLRQYLAAAERDYAKLQQETEKGNIRLLGELDKVRERLAAVERARVAAERLAERDAHHRLRAQIAEDALREARAEIEQLRRPWYRRFRFSWW
jgi:hypothetical protein